MTAHRDGPPPTLRGVVALDGPSGTGKSTVSRTLAATLSAAYLDTGSMYRAATLAVLRAGLDPHAAAAAAVAAQADLGVGTDPAGPSIALAGQDVAGEIRGVEVTGAVSAVSAHPVVREHLVARQRRLIETVLRGGGGIVVEGRDIGTVVAPDAGLKIYLTASEEVRAARRDGQDRCEGRATDLSATLLAVRRRDTLDSGRAHSPLRTAPDAVTLDTSELDLSAVLAQLLRLVAERGLLVDPPPDPAPSSGEIR